MPALKEKLKEVFPSEPRTKAEEALKDSSEESYYSICLAGQGAHPWPCREEVHVGICSD